MACHPRATEWTTIIHTHLPPLTKPQAPVLALGSLGMVLARCCALTAVSAFLAMGLHRQEDAVRQQVREFGYEATAKRGPARQALVIETCWVPLWAWVVAPWAGPPVALALAATPWGSRLPVVALRGVSRGWALPVAWSVLAATAPQACAGRGGAGCATCVGRSHGPGRAWAWRIGAWTPAGCVGASPGWRGTRFCASTRGARSVPRATGAGAR